MATKGLIRSIRSLSIGSHRHFCSTAKLGCSTIITDNVRVPPIQMLWHPHTKLQQIKNESAQETKVLEFQFTTRLAEPPRNITIQTPGFSKTDIVIGHVPATNMSAILDPLSSISMIGDVVPNKITDVVGDNPTTINRQPAYEARHIQKIRRWKMNKHRLVKFRKKMKTHLIKKSMEKTKRKVAQNVAICQAIKQDGEQFDALEFVKERLALAKSGGYVQDIWKEPDNQPLVPWRAYRPMKRKVKTYEVKVNPPKFLTQQEKREMRKAMKKKKQQGG